MTVAGVAALGAIGDALRRAGLTPRALAAWAGTDHLPLLAARVAADGRPGAPLAREPIAARALAAFVAGHEVELRGALGGTLADTVSAGLVTEDGRHARVAILPLGRALLVCDRADADDTAADALCWPDDSSYHLARVLPPTRVDRWLDLGSGSGFAPLLRPELAHAIAGADLNARAVDAMVRGAALSRITHVSAFASDLADGVPAAWRTCELVSFNAPIPDGDGATHWRAAPRAVLDRAWPAIASCLAPGGIAVVHSTLDALPSHAHAPLAGDQVTVVYTPPTMRRAFAVTWWCPSAAPRRLVVRRELTAPRPHLDWDDRAAAIAGSLLAMH